MWKPLLNNDKKLIYENLPDSDTCTDTHPLLVTCEHLFGSKPAKVCEADYLYEEEEFHLYGVTGPYVHPAKHNLIYNGVWQITAWRRMPGAYWS